MSYGPKPWHQTNWDFRAAFNFIFGGAGAVKKFGRTSSLIDQVGGAFPDICAADEAVGRCRTRRLSN